MSIYIAIALIAVILFSPVVIFQSFVQGFLRKKKLIRKYELEQIEEDIHTKKHPEADVPRFRTLIMLASMASVLGALLLAFQWQPPHDELVVEKVVELEEDEIEVIPQTRQNVPPPPPPPPPPPEIIEVDDANNIEEELEVLEVDFDDGAVIPDAPEFTGYPELPEEPEPEPEEPDFFVIVEDMPVFPGGEVKMYEWLGQNIKYPQVAKENGIEGKVYVRFIVDKTGQVTNVQLLRGIGGGCDEEAVRVVNMMPKWKPGNQRGKPVRVQFTIPIHFRLG